MIVTHSGIADAQGSSCLSHTLSFDVGGRGRRVEESAPRRSLRLGARRASAEQRLGATCPAQTRVFSEATVLTTFGVGLAAFAWTFGFAFCVVTDLVTGSAFTGATSCSSSEEGPASGPTSASASGASGAGSDPAGSAEVSSCAAIEETSGTIGSGWAEEPRSTSILTGFGGALLPGPGSVIRSGRRMASAIDERRQRQSRKPRDVVDRA